MSGKRYTDEFKVEVVRSVTERGYSVTEVADRLGVSIHSLYQWVKRFGPDSEKHVKEQDQDRELKRLKAELRRVTEERDILKKAAAYFAKESG